jgi:hypothetical protein
MILGNNLSSREKQFQCIFNETHSAWSIAHGEVKRIEQKAIFITAKTEKCEGVILFIWDFSPRSYLENVDWIGYLTSRKM